MDYIKVEMITKQEEKVLFQDELLSSLRRLMVLQNRLFQFAQIYLNSQQHDSDVLRDFLFRDTTHVGKRGLFCHVFLNINHPKDKLSGSFGAVS